MVPDAQQDTLHAAIEAGFEKGTEIHADMHVAYNKLDKKGYGLKRTNMNASGA